MKYIRIKNAGEIEPQALHLVGASTKRSDLTKIGQFGSGNKYALAYFLRNQYQIKIYAGESEITIETKRENFRDQVFEVIHVNNEKTSITTEMGKDWQFWQAIREIYCNALDEGSCTMDFIQKISPIAGETHFYIENKRDAADFILNFDNYFATNKKVLFECEQGRILEKTGTEANIYRKGIKCNISNKTSVFDYDFTDIAIDENRLVKYSWQVEERIWDLVYRCTDKEVINQILHNSGNHDFIEGCISDISTIHCSNPSEEFKETITEINVAPKGFAGMLKPDEVHNHVILPTKVFQSVRGIIGDENVGDKFKVGRNGSMFRGIEANKLQCKTLEDAQYFLGECGFEIPYEIVLAIFDDKNIMGCAYDGKIYISELCIEKGVNEVVNTILEEYIHLKYKVMDETRAFQTAMLTEFISYMKKVNSFCI